MGWLGDFLDSRIGLCRVLPRAGLGIAAARNRCGALWQRTLALRTRFFACPDLSPMRESLCLRMEESLTQRRSCEHSAPEFTSGLSDSSSAGVETHRKRQRNLVSRSIRQFMGLFIFNNK